MMVKRENKAKSLSKDDLTENKEKKEFINPYYPEQHELESKHDLGQEEPKAVDNTDEARQILDRIQLGGHSSEGINYTHWLQTALYIIDNPVMDKKTFSSRLVSVLCVRERTVKEFVDCLIAWDVLRIEHTTLTYNRTFKGEK